MTSSESEGQPPPRKRSRTSANGDEQSNKKARGRPRVDTQDATAADRRRTQIRLAQRAYRQRKETTIASLKQRNAHLQDIIEKMNKSFLAFNELAVKSGLLRTNPRLGQELKSVTENFVTLARAAETEEDHEDHEADDDTGTPAGRPRSPPRGQHTDVGWGYSARFLDIDLSPAVDKGASQQEEQSTNGSFFPIVPNSPRELARQHALVRARPMTVGEIFDQQRTQADQQLPFGLMDMQGWSRPEVSNHQNPHTFPVNIPTPDISPLISPPTGRLPTPPFIPALSKTPTISLTTKTVKPDWTYSFDETTFARRLTRAALETGFHLLSNAHQRPAALNYVFKLSLPYLGLEELRNRFKITLSRGTDEDLDSWETPFIHLGGAGTHYPRKDTQGNVIPLPNAWNLKSLGPRRIRAENTVDPSRSHDLEVDLTGFEGEWFDANDVQGYLAEKKGCNINPRDTFAEVMIEVDEDETPATAVPLTSIVHARSHNLQMDFSSLDRAFSTSNVSPGLSNGSSSTDSTSSKSTPGGHNVPFNSFNSYRYDNENDVSALFEEPLGLDLAPGFANNNMATFSADAFVDTSNLPIGLDLMGAEVEMPVVQQKKTKAAWVDVSKLVDEIIRHGVCLGRSPGFRRKDVDMAFQASLIHAF
ncbi:hypothetical protein K491DRAFT_585408 [Lophiostoma macrostomum CBS 122681]|uniref:BZIP domain-containing protein n=1 Tax=Lophiostoma macrostomum CBS 122681 TaxID=1314788 RepID=A0A6A6TQS7_9PLEO|nr:hypothetical protein K491DRAFT_585408 [Lophiostoma macrostomum CBS 122681]